MHPEQGLFHDGAVGRAWPTASARRRDLIRHRDDTSHVEPLLAAGADLVRQRATIVDIRHVRSAGTIVEADHIVLATGAAPIVPDIEGLDEVRDRT